MKREVVQDFLNLPGIAGLALMDGRSRPYFCGVDRSLNFQQKEALAQGIQQVINTTPADFEFFEFQFSGHQVYIYKLTHGIILLVLAVNGGVPYCDYAAMVECLKAELQQDAANGIATFRLLAGSTTLSGQNYWKQPGTSANTGSATADPAPPGQTATPETASQSAIASSAAAGRYTASLEEVIAAMNHLSQYAAQYLGPMVVTNYWRATQPEQEWFVHFQIERSAQITCSMPSSSFTPEQHQWIREWVAAFIDRCSKVMRNLPRSLHQGTVLDDRQKSLLFSDSN
ncbi:MAG: hypothetical protein Kow00121_22740 [Elainellaceae cyanobacterium]